MRERDPALAALANGTFVLAWLGPGGEVLARGVSAEGALLGTVPTPLGEAGQSSTWIRSAASGDRVAVVWSHFYDGGTTVTEATVLDATLSPALPGDEDWISSSPPPDQGVNSGFPLIGGGADGFTLAWSEAGSTVITQRADDLETVRCTGIEEDLVFRSVVGLDDGFAASVYFSQDEVLVAEFDGDCNLHDVAEAHRMDFAGEILAVALTRADTGLGLVWTDDFFFDPANIHHRFFGFGLCDSFGSALAR
jgi:hypothetical protein